MRMTVTVQKGLCTIAVCMMILNCLCVPVPAEAASRTSESLITDVKNPSNGVIKCDVKVPAGEKVDYSVTLTPDKAGKAVEVINGSLKNRTRKTVTKTVTMHVKHLSNKYRISASYTKEIRGEEVSYRDVDSAASALKKTAVTKKMKWDFTKLGSGKKDWEYRYKYVPYKGGFKKYMEVFDKRGKRIKNYVKQIVPLTKVTKIIKEMKAR